MPEDMIRLQYVLDTARKFFELYGFEPLDTPAFEDWKLLAAKLGGGEEIKKEIYYFKDKSSRELGLRFDLTVPLSRVVASTQLPKPFRRYAIGKVWRYDNPGASRWREFWQADADIVGSSSSEADAEVISVACAILKALGFDDFIVRINNRKITESFVRSLGIKNCVDVFRSIDKLGKIGEAGVKKELKSKKIPSEQMEKILDFVKIADINKIENLDGAGELKDIISSLGGYAENIKVDMSLVRGLEYYTGTVFEISVPSGRLSLSVAGGGRYDNLVQALGGSPAPATGISLGVERIVEVLKESGTLQLPRTPSKVYIASIGDVKKDVAETAKKMREAGVACEFDVMSRDLRKQLEYANAKSIPYVIVIGEKEIKSRKVRLRNMKSGVEKEIELDGLEGLMQLSNYKE